MRYVTTREINMAGKRYLHVYNNSDSIRVKEKRTKTIKIRLVPSHYLSVFWDERRLRIRLRRARGLMGREEGKIATARFRSLETCMSFFPFP